MKFLEAVRKCKFDEGEYLESPTQVHTIRLDKNGYLQANTTDGYDEFFNDAVRWEWEIKQDYLCFDEAMDRCMAGDVIRCTSNDCYYTYVPAIKRFISFRSDLSISSFFTRSDMNRFSGKWYVVEGIANES